MQSYSILYNILYNRYYLGNVLSVLRPLPPPHPTSPWVEPFHTEGRGEAMTGKGGQRTKRREHGRPNTGMVARRRPHVCRVAAERLPFSCGLSVASPPSAIRGAGRSLCAVVSHCGKP